MEREHFDVLIVGAGLSGIGAACHLQARCPGRSYAILEARAASGGTWDLFRYPGVRSDSDMYTLGYAFRPWREPKAIADGPSILNYIRETARAHGVDRRIRYGCRVVRADWSSATATWTVEAETDGRPAVFTCGFLLTCTGYYDYAGGYQPDFEGIERFAGQVVHPQAWPEGLDYAGKRVVVIGSGATAVTVAPAMAATAAQVTMLQRSPTYVVSRPSRDAFADRMNARLPPRLAYAVVRWRNVLLSLVFFNLARRRPGRVKQRLIGWVRAHLGPDYDVETHFTPRYHPWDQRLCLVPDGDLFKAIRGGRMSVVTDAIAGFEPTGLRLASGRALEADVVVMATGLRLKLLGGMALSVDGAPVDLSKRLNYKGIMCEGVPNLALVFGYTNASWTLKADLSAAYVCRLLNHMRRRGYDTCMPRPRGPGVEERPIIDFTSSYVRRSIDQFPKQGSRAPWRLRQNYFLDLLALRFGRLSDGVLRFSRRA